MASRGCPFSCPYCCNDILKKLYKGQFKIRRRSVDNVIYELEWAKANFKISEVYFLDEVLDELTEDGSLDFLKDCFKKLVSNFPIWPPM